MVLEMTKLTAKKNIWQTICEATILEIQYITCYHFNITFHYHMKKIHFENIPDLGLYTAWDPSNWTEEIDKQAPFLEDYSALEPILSQFENPRNTANPLWVACLIKGKHTKEYFNQEFLDFFIMWCATQGLPRRLPILELQPHKHVYTSAVLWDPSYYCW